VYIYGMTEHWPETVYDYILSHTRIEDPLLRRMEERAGRDNFPIIGPLVGPWLYTFTLLSNAKRVFEMGSGYGYSTWYFAKALQELGGGVVSHVVWDEVLSKEARGWMEQAGLTARCDFQVSEAVLALSGTAPGLDLIFMDIDKVSYPNALDVIEMKLRPGGLLLVDNVLWSGRVADSGEQDEACLAVKQFNGMLRERERWQYLINPLRDGLGVARFR
jgi:caffeoyl-CoA O-methyltransferase